ncbi:unnamed protein product [Lactuca virosa]|uniref:acetate--CoA ligase n=1 Tax=Lactuca virosa TaxID=75947 RepID=A0AAU9P5F1_9ASTR|nr:unnamed protein product [Lactuca virosa]
MYNKSIEDPGGFGYDISSEFYWKEKWGQQVYLENLDVIKGSIKIEAPVNKQQSSKVSDIISKNKDDVSTEEVDEEVDDADQEGVEPGELPPLDNSDPLPEVANEGTQVRRSERVRAPSTRYPTSNYILLTSEGEPESFQEAQSHIDKANWQKAMEEEMNSLQKNQTYELLANFLKDSGVKKGDIVIIYLPMLMELPITMLACARIGVVHSVVFAGYSAESLLQRIMDCKPKIVVTCNAVKRGKKYSISRRLLTLHSHNHLKMEYLKALANALSAAPSMWTLGNAGMGAL